MRVFKWIYAVCTIAAMVCTAAAQPAVTSPKTPVTNSVSPGGKVTWKVSAASANPPLKYHWRFNGQTIAESGSSSLTLTNISIAQAGAYSVLVSDIVGSVESPAFVLDVDNTFIEVAAGVPVATSSSGLGVAWGDMNNDGYPDLFVASGPSLLFTNRGDGTFGRFTAGSISSESGGGGAAWGDYDNDGWVDMVIPKQGSSVLHRNEQGRSFVKMATNRISKIGSEFGSAAWGDYDRDGFIDLFICNGFSFSAGRNSLLRNNGDGSFSSVTNSIVVKDTPGYSVGAAWADYDNDGWLDLFVSNLNEFASGGALRANFLYRNIGGGDFVKVTNGPIAQLKGTFFGCSWGDYDNDGWFDLFVSNASGKSGLFRNAGDGSFLAVTNAGPVVTDTFAAQGSGWADYDNDGWLDLFVCGFVNSQRNPPDMRDFLYRNNGNGTFTRIERGSLVNDNGEGNGMAWADANRDGYSDLFVSNARTMPGSGRGNFYYQNSEGSNGWLTVRCEGRISNRAGIGAKVRVKATIGGQTFWQLRQISGSSGYYSQGEMTASFGLGDAERAELVRVEWPSGMVQEFHNVAARQFLTVTEPSKLQVAASARSGEIDLMLHGGTGIPYRIEASADLRSWSPMVLFTNLSNGIRWKESFATGSDVRFYRVVELR